MQTEDQIEQSPLQRILAMDTRAERPLRLCPACDSNKARKLGIKNELEIACCTVCRSVYAPYTPWYTSEWYYANYYDHRFCVEPPIVTKRIKEITAKFACYRQTNRLLDVGCGAGLLLQAARDHGWNAQGIDVSASSVEQVRGLGFEVFHGELAQAQLASEQFDVITAVEILEHLFDPATLAREVHRLLRPGGLFWITTPHSRSLGARVLGLNWRLICPPEHLQLFSIEGMRKLLLRAGFRKVRFETTGINPLELRQALHKQKDTTAQENFEALESKYRLNEAMTRNSTRRVLKNTVNGLLNLSKLGESLKAFAIR